MRKALIIIALFCFQFVSGQQEPGDFLKARVQMLSVAYDSAIIYLDNAIKEQPSNIEAIYNRGICYFELKQYDKAISDFLQVNRLRSSKGSLMLARIEARLHHEDLAIKYLREHMKSSYKIAEKEILLIEDFGGIESTPAWKSFWNEKEWYSRYDKQLQEACYLKTTEKYPEAINILNELNKKGFKRAIVNRYMAEIYLSSGNNKAALEAINKAIQSNPRNQESLKLRIQLLQSMEEFEKARDDCNRLLRIAPDAFDYYLIAGKNESLAGAYRSAINKVDFYLELYPDSAKAHNLLGEIHFKNGKFIKALSSFNHTLELDTSNALYYFNRGRTYNATKTYRYAAKDFSMSLDLDPLNPETWFYKGIADSELGDGDSACYDFNKAFQYGKYEAREYLNKLCGR